MARPTGSLLFAIRPPPETRTEFRNPLNSRGYFPSKYVWMKSTVV
jgi:hypothetical protein